MSESRENVKYAKYLSNNAPEPDCMENITWFSKLSYLWNILPQYLIIKENNVRRYF